MLKILTTLTRQENERRARYNDENKNATALDEHEMKLRQMLPYPETILAFSNEQDDQDEESLARAQEMRESFKASIPGEQ